MKENIISLIERATANWQERHDIMEDLKKVIESSKLLGENSSGSPWHEMHAKIKEVDDTFIRKFYHFPGDITTHRIAKTLVKVLAVDSSK
jgi:hypothetical protein